MVHFLCVWCMLSVLNNQCRLLVNTRPCKRINKTMQVWMTLRVLLTKLLELFVSSVTSILLPFFNVDDLILHCLTYHTFTLLFFNDHFTNSRCLVQCFISSNKTSLSFLENFIMMVLVVIAVWKDTKNNNGLSKRKQQRISVYLYSVRQQNWNYRHWWVKESALKKASCSKTHTHTQFPCSWSLRWFVFPEIVSRVWLTLANSAIHVSMFPSTHRAQDVSGMKPWLSRQPSHLLP